MQKISPLRSSIEAFNKFRAQRKAQGAPQAQESKTQTNPFGITFKGNLIQGDVFESPKKAENKENDTQYNADKQRNQHPPDGFVIFFPFLATIICHFLSPHKLFYAFQ